MQTQSTTITTDSSTTTEPNPYQTPVKKKAPRADANASNMFFIQTQTINTNNHPKAIEPKTEEELLDRIFSPENINNAKNLSYNNAHYLVNSRYTPIRKRRFVGFDAKIDITYPFLRYTTDQLKELLDDANDVNKNSSSKDERIQPQEIPLQITKDNKRQLPSKIIRRQLFPGNSTACTQTSGPVLNESLTEQAKMQRSPGPVKRKFNQLADNTFTSPSIAEKDRFSPFDDGDMVVLFRFVIGSATGTLFSIGHDDTRMSHGQLAAKTEDAEASCNAAGIIGFEKSAGKWLIKTVSNKTGHFKCGLESFLTSIGMLFTDFTSYLSEEITLINESLENPKDKKSFTFAASALKKRYEDCALSSPLVMPAPSNTRENTAASEANSQLFFSTPKKARLNVSSSSTRDNELVQLVQGTDDAQAEQQGFKLL